MKEKQKAKRRVEIAKDVIAQIEKEKYNVESGRGYILSLNDEKGYIKYGIEPVTASDLKKVKKNCSVCALGSMLLSRIYLYNHATWNDIGADKYVNTVGCGLDQVIESLDDYFSLRQMALIEAAFEIDDSLIYEYNDAELEAELENSLVMDYAMEFGRSFDNGEDRLLAIMQNIVDHKGTFVPAVQYEIV